MQNISGVFACVSGLADKNGDNRSDKGVGESGVGEGMEQQGSKKNGITEGVIWKQILIFFFPILVGTFFSSCIIR